jgi:hypothetical protein
MMKHFLFMILLMGALFGGVHPLWADAPHPSWAREFSKTYFSNTTIDYADILSGGPPRDGIPAINDPKFVKNRRYPEFNGYGPCYWYCCEWYRKSIPTPHIDLA